MDWRRLLRWLASYPLDRVRAKRLPPPGPRVLSPTGNALKDMYNRALIEAQERIVFSRFGGADMPPRFPRTLEWRRYGSFTGVADVPGDQEVPAVPGQEDDGL